MVRPSSEQIDLGILDVAAGLFAEHGWDHTSLQQVARASGYSKTGLLHRFATKDRLREAVVARCLAWLQEVRAEAGAVTDPVERDHLLVRRFTEQVATGPGRLALAAADSGRGDGRVLHPAFAPVVDLLTECFDLADADTTRQLRVAACLASISSLSMTFRHLPPEVLGPQLVPIALDALGHHG